MTKERIGQEFRLKEIDEINYFNEELKQNQLISKKHKKVCKILNSVNCTEHILILVFTVTKCVSTLTFASSVGIPVGIASFAATIKMCVITAEITKCKSIFKKKKINPCTQSDISFFYKLKYEIRNKVLIFFF